MRAGIGVLLSLGILLLSCSNRNDEAPETILPKERMEDILWDLIRADVYMRDYVADSARLDGNITLYKEIFHLHETNQQQFRESFAWYRSRPAEMKEILDSLETRSKVQVPKQAEPRKRPVFDNRDSVSME